MNARYKAMRVVLIFWTLFIGLGAVLGSTCMFIDPGGKLLQMDGLLPYFRVLPFSETLFTDYTFSGIALLAVNGVTNLTAATLLFFKKKSGVVLGMTFGFTLMLWITIQFVIFPTNFLSVSYFIFGVLQFVTGYICFVGMKQSEFVEAEEQDFPSIGSDKSKLIVYFSRTGYTKRLALEAAAKSGAVVFEIVAKERIKGDAGFWWCGRYGMLKKSMPIENLNTLLSNYDEVTLYTPVWVLGISAPMRKFCEENAGKIKKVNYVFTHFMNSGFFNLAAKTDKILRARHGYVRSYRVRFGVAKEIKQKRNLKWVGLIIAG